MKRKELLAACEALVKSYDPAIMTVDAHVDEELKDFAQTDRVFLHQVLYGCVRYKDVLKVVLSNFYQDNSAKCSRNDYTKFLIMGYLAIFRLDEIGMAAFEGFVTTQNPTAMHVFLTYLFDDTILQGPVKAEWLRLLDQAYVETQLIDKLVKHRPQVEQVLDHLHAKAFGMAAARENLKQNGGVVRVASKEPTVPVAPNITKPRPRPVPEPTRIPLEMKAHPVPDLNKLTLADIQEKQQQRREAIKEQVLKKYQESAAQPFQLEETKSNLEAIKQEVEDQRMAELNKKFKAKPAPNFSEKDAAVKLNTAAILREDALYKKKQEKEAKLIQVIAYESDLRDASEFYRWQSDMLKKDDAAHRAQVEKRRLEMAQAQHEAIEARYERRSGPTIQTVLHRTHDVLTCRERPSLRAKVENRDVANQMKLVSKENEEKRRLEGTIGLSHRQVALEIKLTRESAPREAEDRVKAEKQKQREAVNALLEQERARKAAQDAIEQAQREDLIRQIRALDRVHREHVTVHLVDSSVANLGLLDEMSLVELRERLQLRKVEEAELEAQRRELILQEKKEKELDLKARVSNISRIRPQRAERDAEFQRLKEEGELIANKRMFLGAAKNMLEMRHFMQQTMGAERQASNRQEAVQKEARVEAQTKETEKKMRQTYRHKKAIEHDAALRENEMLMDKAMGETKQRLRHDKDTRKAIVRHEKARRMHANEILQHRNVYATQVSAADVASAHWNFLGVEIFEPYVAAANAATRQHQSPQRTKNLAYVHANINNSLETLLSGIHQVGRVSLLFPDPWGCGLAKDHKNKKRRVMSAAFAKVRGRLANAMPLHSEFYLASDYEDLARDIRAHLLATGGFNIPVDGPYVPTLTASAIRQSYENKKLQKERLLDTTKAVGKVAMDSDASTLWLATMPLGVPTERDVICENQWRPVYRLVLIRNGTAVPPSS
ncbi:hypothetical protein DYB32_002550 [Aphanomyces invadans]|uniref:tRNA (guanine(46)-N(7))-methyltransferase n=1 Tax=Aphanomyces invadans TaxID=157072 RepID=A0A418B307_9STRA|nr:hypothetical protein DYB32_002550 [Aphanomyces invadans]